MTFFSGFSMEMIKIKTDINQDNYIRQGDLNPTL